ncbi:MAG TPA: hypothetical protein VGC21_21550 [Telluria sp.]|jgi:hypothetical protein
MKVKTLGPVELDGKKIKPGSVIDISESQADQMIDAGAAEAIVKAKAADPVPDPKKDA